MLARVFFAWTAILALLLLAGCASQTAEPDEVVSPKGTAKAAGGGLATGNEDSSRPLAPEASKGDAPLVLFLGDSLSAGYGLPEEQAFPALIQQKIEQAGLDFEVVNAGVSGDTSAGGLRRVNWLARRPVSVLILELGGNDGLRGVDLEDTRNNLQAIIDQFREKNPNLEVVIAGMMMPPNLGPQYTEQFRNLYPDLARDNHATLIPFLLEGVAGDPSLNQPDGIHPTAEGHRIVADVVWNYLEPVLRRSSATPARAEGS